jgi:hypothetical protein
LGIIIALFLLILTLVAPLVLTVEPNAQNPSKKLLAPISSIFWEPTNTGATCWRELPTAHFARSARLFSF